MNVLKDYSGCSKGNICKYGKNYQLGGCCKKPSESSQIAKLRRGSVCEHNQMDLENIQDIMKKKVKDAARVTGLSC